MAGLIGQRLVEQLGIDREFLSRCRTRKQRKQKREIIEIWNETLHAHECDVYGWNGCDHASVAFVGDDADRTGFCNAKVDSAETDIGGEKNFAQYFAGGGGECGNVGGVGDAKLFVKEFRNLFFAKMRCRGDDVTGSFMPKLNDVFAEVSFDDLDAFFFKSMVEFDLFADHAFGFGDK